MTERYVVANCQYGIGNRLKGLISSMRIAEESSAQLLLYWPEDRYVSCRFEDLFATSIAQVNTSEFERLRQLPETSPYRVVTTWHLQTLPQDPLPKRFTRVRPSLTGRDIDLEYERIPPAVRENLLHHVRTLQPSPEVADKIDTYVNKAGSATVGISIRSWPDDQKRVALFDMDNVYATIDGLGTDSFFLSCDAQDVTNEIVARYGARAHTFPRSTPANDRCSRVGMQEIMAELLLLARCSRLWVPWLSTFPEMAWWLGDCKAQVSVIPPKSYLFRRVCLGRDYTAYCLLGRWRLAFSAMFGPRLLKHEAMRLLNRS